MMKNNQENQIVLGGGCFWCLEATFRLVKGVTNLIVGYSDGNIDQPTYEQVCQGNTGYIEVIKLTFNPTIISLDSILTIFFTLHDPTSLARQGNDVGYQYSSAVFYTNNDQKNIIDQVVLKVSKLYTKPIVTIIKPLKNFYVAEEEHQDYFTKHPNQAYCQIIINPKITKLRQYYSRYLASD